MPDQTSPNTTPISFGSQNEHRHKQQSNRLPNDPVRTIAPGREATQPPAAPQREQASVENKTTEVNASTQPSEPARPVTVSREQALPDVLVTVHEAVELFRTAGLERSIRTVQKYCSPQRKGRALKCHVTPTENGVRYMIERGSIDDFVQKAGAQAPVGKNDAPEPVAVAPENVSAKAVIDDLAVYEHPYVKRLEQEIEKKETRYDDLQIRYENAMDMAQNRLVELQQASAVAQSESLGKFMLEAKRIDQGDNQAEQGNSEIGDSAFVPHVPHDNPVSTPPQSERRQE